MIDRRKHIPLYIQLADLIRQQIINGTIKPGDKLISEAAMIRKYQLGRLTIREALSVLVNEGLLEKHHGKGTYCKAKPVDEKQYNFDLLLDMKDVYFIPYYLHSICEVFEKEDCSVKINDTKNNSKTIVSILEKIAETGSDGVIFQPSNIAQDQPDEVSQALSHLEKKGIPYIMLDGTYDNVPQSNVILNEFRVGELAAEFLLQYGHSEICMIYCSNQKDSLLRLSGFKNILGEAPILIDFSPVLANDIKNTIAKTPNLTAFFCNNDIIAKQCVSIINDLGYRVPEDISVISVDNTVIASTMLPSLTTISHPKEKLGEVIAKALLDIKKKKTIWPYQKTFEPEIILRNSVKNIKVL
ncbi:MAG: substrate-binding domain-containing protein [Clostridia bacterium]|nr:substrate-binding domain-containing protein [Clostridia bacterium]